MIGGDCLRRWILVICAVVGHARRQVGMGKEVDDALDLVARRRRIEKPGRDQVIEGDGVASVRVVKLARPELEQLG